MNTLQIAKNDLRQGWETPDGATCACCGQKVKLYKRNLYGSPLVGLINLYKLDRKNSGYYHISNLGQPKAGGGDFAKLVFWGLIEEQINENDKTRTSGYWRITDLGIKFAANKVQIPKSKFIYNNKRYRDSDEMVFISEVKSNGFDYRELMGYLI